MSGSGPATSVLATRPNAQSPCPVTEQFPVRGWTSCAGAQLTRPRRRDSRTYLPGLSSKPPHRSTAQPTKWGTFRSAPYCRRFNPPPPLGRPPPQLYQFRRHSRDVIESATHRTEAWSSGLRERREPGSNRQFHLRPTHPWDTDHGPLANFKTIRHSRSPGLAGVPRRGAPERAGRRRDTASRPPYGRRVVPDVRRDRLVLRSGGSLW